MVWGSRGRSRVSRTKPAARFPPLAMPSQGFSSTDSHQSYLRAAVLVFLSLKEECKPFRDLPSPPLPPQSPREPTGRISPFNERIISGTTHLTEVRQEQSPRPALYVQLF